VYDVIRDCIRANATRYIHSRIRENRSNFKSARVEFMCGVQFMLMRGASNWFQFASKVNAQANGQLAENNTFGTMNT
jgi:hypothetical protein